LIGTVGSIILTGILPVAGLWLILAFTLHAYYLETALGVLAVNLIVRYGKAASNRIAFLTRQRSEAKRLKISHSRELMFQHIQPSAFTLRYSRIGDDELFSSTYVDDLQHWVVAVLFFFNPYSERGAAPEGKVAKAIYEAFRTQVKNIIGLWVSCWIGVIVLAALLAYPAVIPKAIRPNPEVLGTVLIVLGIAISLWTLAWAYCVVVLWLRERFTVTDENYARTSRRLPFQRATDPALSTRYLRSITEEITLPGKILGYSHLTLESEQQQEQIPQVRFVSRPARTKEVLNRLAVRNANKGKKDRPVRPD
jgi:hypothetical protein